MFDPSKKCPIWRKRCIEHGCAFYIPLRGRDPQTGAPLDEFGCVFVWNVVAALEGNKEIRESAAAVESFRNVVASGQGPVLPGSPMLKRLDQDKGHTQ